MKNKKLIRLTESDLHRIVNEFVNRILRESSREQTVEAIPNYALPYLINGDPAGLYDEDIQEIDAWMECSGATEVACPNDDDQPYFLPRPAFGKACDVCDCVCFLG